MRRTRIHAFVAFILFLPVTACGGGVFQQPGVSLQDVQLAGLGLRGGTLLVNLEVTNPNRFALSANQLSYELAIADSESSPDTIWLDFASGTYEEPFSVGAGETGIVQVPVEFSYSGLGGAGSSLLRAGTFSYRASGSIDVRTPLGTYDVPFRRGGMVTLLGAR